MPDYSLGRAHGKIEIDYDGSGADRAVRGIDQVAASSDKMDKSLDKSNQRLDESTEEMGRFAKASDDAGRSQDVFRDKNGRLYDSMGRYVKEAESATEATDQFAESARRAGDSTERYTERIHDVEHAHESLHDSHHRSRADLDDFSEGADKAEDSAHGLGKTVDGLTDVLTVFAPEVGVAASAVGHLGEMLGVKLGSAASSGRSHIAGFIKDIPKLELAIGKISGLALGGLSLGGLGALGGAGALQGVTQVAGAVRQLSGAIGLLPAVISGAAFSMGTLKIAFHGVGDALKDMMADDPKKFLEDIKNMGPVAGQAMMQIAGFRDMFKLAGASIQDSFFSQVINDIKPLIQTWLPAVTQAMSQVSGIFGQSAHMFAGFLQQPQTIDRKSVV